MTVLQLVNISLERLVSIWLLVGFGLTMVMHNMAVTLVIVVALIAIYVQATPPVLHVHLVLLITQ